MATINLSLQILRPIPSSSLSPRRLPKNFLPGYPNSAKTRWRSKWTIKLSVVDQNLTPQKSTAVNVQQLVGFLYDDLPHLFDEQGIDRTAYDETVKFRDPITKHDSISGYLFNIALLKNIFKPQFFLHWVKPTHQTRGIDGHHTDFLPKPAPALAGITSQQPIKHFKPGNLPIRTNQNLKWEVRLNLEDRSLQKPTLVTIEQLVDYLYDTPCDLNELRVDQKMFDADVKFRDPITKHDGITGYLFNVAFLKFLSKSHLFLHWVKQTGAYEITTRWSMVMTFMLLPWKPELVFTGTSVMGINPETGKFCSHLDLWDSIQNNDYFSLEGLWDVLKQLRMYKTPDLGTPTYQILKRTSKYEVRRYEPFVVVETTGDKLSGSSGFNAVTGYIFGKNSKMEKIPMTTPVFTKANDAELSEVSIQVVLPLEKDLNNLPEPDQETVSLRKVEGCIAAVLKFSGKPTEDVVREKEKALRSSLVEDGLKPKMGCLLARYNDPGRTWSFIMRNEVLVWLEEFSLE